MNNYLCVGKFVSGLLLVLLAACNASSPALNLVSDTNMAKVGESFRVTLQAEQISGLTAAEAHLAFDPALLEVVAIQDGDFLQPDFVVQNVFDNSAGTIDYAVAQLDRPAADGSGALLVVEFRAKAAGETTIRFRSTPAASAGALLADADGGAIQVSLGEASLEIAP